MLLSAAQMTKTTSLHHHRPASPPATAVNGDADRIHSPRREGFSQWLHSHQQHEPYSDIEPPPLYATVQHVQPPPPQPQPEEQEVHQTEQQRNASAFMAAFLRDAASGHRDHGDGDGPTRNYVSHKTVPIPTKGITTPAKTRFVRSASTGSAKSGCSSIDNLSECLNEVARSSGETTGEFVVRTKTSGNKGKRGCRSLNNSLHSYATGDDVSVVSNLSDWNELVEKTFYGHSNDDNVRSQWEHTHKDRHVEDKHHSGEEDCSEGKRLNQQQFSPQSLKPILKVKEAATTSLHGSDLDDSYLDASGRSNMTDIERLDDFFEDVLETRDLHVGPEEEELDEMMKNLKDCKQSQSKHEERPRNKPTLSMDDMVDMMNNLFDDESGEQEQGRVKKKSRQFHPEYDLGVAARSRHDMVDNDDPEKTMECISRLEMWDFAFVRRTNNEWTYSIISDRTEDTIRFVVDDVGRTKMIDRKGWLKNHLP